MKKFLPIYLGVLIIISIFCIYVFMNKEEDIDTSNRFKDEYSAYNDKTINDKTYPYVDISSDNLYYYATEDDIKNLFNNGSGVIYFGFPTCPWCRNMVSLLNDVGVSYGIDKIYYYNIKDIRSSFSINDNKLETTKGSEFYYYLLEELDNYLEEYSYEGINTNEKRLYAPSVVFINAGEVTSVVVGTVESQTDPFISLTTDERTELKNKYLEGFKTINPSCSMESGC